MPPADSNTPAPAPSPVPEPPKKPGFFARLFGKKQEEAPAVSPEHRSHTPAPQLDDNETSPKTDETAAPSGEGETTPPTLDVPAEVEGTPAPENDGVVPPLSTEGGDTTTPAGDVPAGGETTTEEEETPPTGPVSPSA